MLVLEETSLEEIEKDYNNHQKKMRDIILHNLNTQDNRACGHPMYCVMEQVKLDEPTGHYIDCMREIFFTNYEAEKFIKEESYNYKGKLYLYVKSGNRNEGWKLARELMKGNDDDR